MLKINEQLLDNLNYIKGTVLGVGLNEELNNNLAKKNNIQNYYAINKIKGKNSTSDGDNEESTFDIHKLYKSFNNKDVDYTICNLDVLKNYIPYFIRDIININDEQIYFYGNNKNDDLEILVKQLKRYNVKIEKKDYGNYLLIIINTKDITIKYTKRWLYFIIDLVVSLIDKVGNIITK